jgi:two-component system chemotaxis sensor kinase CheA
MSKIELDREEPEILAGFVQESREMLDDAEPLLIKLEKISNRSGEIDKEVINTVFRLFHSLKGGAGFLGLSTVGKVTHNAETLLDMFRKGRTIIESSHVDLLNRTCDFIRLLLDNIEATMTDKGFEEQAARIIKDLQSIISQMSSKLKPTNKNQLQASVKPAMENPEAKKTLEVKSEIILPHDKEGDANTTTEDMQLTITPEMIQQFINESEELLEKAEEALLSLEKDPNNQELISQTFRALHNFKGNSGFLGYTDLEEIGHQAETVLDKIREGRGGNNSNVFSLLLEILDFLRDGITQVSKGGIPNIPGKPGLVNLMKDAVTKMSNGKEVKNNTSRKVKVIKEDSEKSLFNKSNNQAILISNQKRSALVEAKSNNITESEKSIRQKALDGLWNGKEHRSGIDRRKGGRRTSDRISGQYQSVRVDVQKLNSLLDLVGELVISEAMVAQNPDLKGIGVPLDRFEKSVRQLDKITRDLQGIVTSIRMIPLSGTFRRMIRLVRDLAQKANKKVDLEIIGEETEMDKTIIEIINDPLIHIIRNAIDHGLESPEEREVNGKSGIGRVILEAKYVGSEVWISIQDDGRGLNREKILKKASEKGLIQDDGSGLQDDEIWQMIFLPGFSTADKVTDVSGRGVGMDVVRRNIENIHGKIDLSSERGKGTTIVLRIPLTLAIIDGMLVRVGHARYTIPIVDIRESWQPYEESITRLPDGQEIINNRGKLYPIVRLHKLFHVPSSYQKLSEGIIILAENGGKPVCLFVDEMLGQQQIVIKGLPSYIGDMPYVSGCTILGDGDISLIIDVAGIISIQENENALTGKLLN